VRSALGERNYAALSRLEPSTTLPYEKMKSKLSDVRKRLDRPLTLAGAHLSSDSFHHNCVTSPFLLFLISTEKILYSHLDDTKQGECSPISRVVTAGLSCLHVLVPQRL
jgi:hypothetical protein